MARRFQLQALLLYKKNLEDLMQVELAQLRDACTLEQERLVRLQQNHHEAVWQLRAHEDEKRLNVELIRLTMDYLESVRHQLVVQAKAVEEALARVEQKRQELVKLTQEKKVLEKLKERFEEELALEMRLKEGRTNDEIGTNLHYRASADDASFADPHAPSYEPNEGQAKRTA